MPVRSDPASATAKWVTNLSNATTAMTNGANRVTVSPGVAAAAAADKWLSKVTQAKSKFAARVGSVTLDQWKTAYTTYGVQRVASGAQAKQGKMLSFQTDWMAYLSANQGKIDRMASTTLEDGIAKATAQIRLNAAFKRSGT
ncbi:MAG TPA: hypothetical protein VIX86_19185 [Streptosporangiaceae bacterium]